MWNKLAQKARFALETLLHRVIARALTQIAGQSLAWLVNQQLVSVEEQDVVLAFAVRVLPYLIAIVVVEAVWSALEWAWHQKSMRFLRDALEAMSLKLEEEQLNTDVALTLPEGASHADLAETRRLADQYGFTPVTRIPGTEDDR